MKLKEISRTATFAWSPAPAPPLLATGSVAGALDESFSNESQLEIWAPDFSDAAEYDLGGEGRPGPKGVVSTHAKFNRIAWGYVDGNRPKGVIAAGMENGELGIWDADKIVASAEPTESLILRNDTHSGPIRGLDFNSIQTNLLASGAVGGEVFIWDLRDPSKPYSPGSRSQKLDEITSLAWNHQVPHILSTASSTGYTVVWDLRGKREVVALAYGGGAGTLAGASIGGIGMGAGGRRGMSDVAWHPDNATRIVTSSEDDTSPVIMVWDLRNARAPEKILTGHEKGVLSLSWCKQDADLLLSCGKDNRVLCWNPQSSEIIGEVPSADNWAFQVQWCPRNPDLFAAGFFDGTIGIHNVQGTNQDTPSQAPTAAASQSGADIFDAPEYTRTTQATLSLSQPPKWLKRPVGATWGYGGKLVSVSNLPGAQGKAQSSVVHVRKVVTEEAIVERAKKLTEAVKSDALSELAKERAGDDPAGASEAWKALLSLFHADSRDELVTLLGFSKEEIAKRVAQAVTNLKEQADERASATPVDQELTETHIQAPREPVVSFAEPEKSGDVTSDVEGGEAEAADNANGAAEATPSEVSASVASDATGATTTGDGESTTTVPSLFGDENIGTPQTDAAADFFSSMGMARGADDTSLHPQVPHTNYPIDSSVAATIGSRPSSAASEGLKNNTFRIYPADESETDRLVTKALVLGDFESAVTLCLSVERFADAILLAVKGGPELLAKTQKAYFEKRTTQLPYLRLFGSIVTNDLADIVQNADLQEWQEIFVVLCTFASQEEFAGLAEQLGQRLEFQSRLVKATEDGQPELAKELRKNATLTYLAAGRLERLVNIWVEELAEEEKAREEGEEQSLYSAHAHALQTFVEKVTVFRSAIKYADSDLQQGASSGQNASTKLYKLSALYDRYLEYADLLVAQGLVGEAVEFLKLTPTDYSGSAVDFTGERERLLVAAGQSAPVAGPSKLAPAPAPAAVPASTSSYGYQQAPVHLQQQQAPQVKQPSAAHSIYDQYTAAAPQQPSGPYAPPITQQPSGPYAPARPPSTTQPPYQTTGATPYAPPNPYGGGPTTSGPGWQQQAPPQPAVSLPPPPRAMNGGPGTASLPPPPKRQAGGWNDAPPVLDRRQTPTVGTAAKPAAITSPFPNSSPQTPNVPFGGPGTPASLPPPPPRTASAQGGRLPPGPPPQRGLAHPPPPQGGPGPYPPSRPPTTGPPGQPQNLPPPPHRGAVPPVGPPNAGPGSPRQPPPGQFAPPPQRGHVAPPIGQAPSGFAPNTGAPYNRATPPPVQQMQAPPRGPGGYDRAMSPPQPTGPYGPPPGAARAAPPPGPGAGIPPSAVGPPPPGGPSMAPPRSASINRAPSQQGPPPPKYPAGDRSHIPDASKPIYDIISGQLNHLKQITPPQQKRFVDDLERRINPLFDALNCETLSQPVVAQLSVLTQAMAAHDRDAALAIHVDLLTKGSLTDDIGLWMSGVKQLIMRL
ncbi:WD40 repeat-like protein [Punctularia strigosozonata HHB-11173 SS5]|uniref:WD40 repeat-like protein n=1 Tax=Punctularia strigosozonata (strain HHB-11173) TaxID=741275 RepID=UPI0004416258|nr:WD40 repeat-like protein [Punctularia strigosozonata HHB-11173 SS5]EIN09101.1 WD40 repeat-like protein [Punctularia strigosozonata HHB-11173 SS5]